ncbi:hypothetical protein [Bdellovibrio sp. HCB-162]|uniref:hypothetical protein n=1 Tax=Bdellovibrio sp. HCB-162 TaxID=3394234 RepID=UPI0039BCC155
MKNLITELKKYPALAGVGVLLSLEHILTFIFWMTEKPLHWILSPSTPSICWPLMDACEKLKPSSEILNGVLGFYLILALASVLFWALRKYRVAIPLLWTLLVIKNIIILQDYRLTGNYHYLPTLITLVFLLIPQRAYSLPFTFFVIYFTAGLLKIDTNWLSGAAINDLLIPPFLTRIGVWYVLVLELGLIFLLFARKNFWFYFLFIQLTVFHLYSWHLTRFFYPSVMLLLLGILLITRPLAPPLRIKDTFKLVLKPRVAKVLLVIFVALQLPQYFIPGDAAMTGEGRMYAMIMYDGRVQCQPHLSIWKKNQEKEELPLQPPWLITRTHCDSMVFWRLAQNACEWAKKDPEVLQVDLMIPVRYEGQKEWQPLVAATNVCEKELNYSSFFPNNWINKLSKSGN